PGRALQTCRHASPGLLVPPQTDFQHLSARKTHTSFVAAAGGLAPLGDVLSISELGCRLLVFLGLGLLLRIGFAAGPFRAKLQLLFRIHTTAALGSATVADRFVFQVAVVQVVVVTQFFARGNVPLGDDPDPSFDLVGLTIRIAAMIDERGQAIAVDDVLAVVQSKEIGAARRVVNRVGLLLRQARTGVLHDERALLDRGSRVAAGAVNF